GAGAVPPPGVRGSGALAGDGPDEAGRPLRSRVSAGGLSGERRTLPGGERRVDSVPGAAPEFLLADAATRLRRDEAEQSGSRPRRLRRGADKSARLDGPLCRP